MFESVKSARLPVEEGLAARAAWRFPSTQRRGDMKFAAALFFLLLAGCYVKNKDLHPCTDNANCTDPAAPVCDLAAQVCVECTPESAAACTGQKPICGADNVCRACTAHADCLASMVCLPDGSCGIEDQVAYVANGGTSATCAKSAPCNTLTAAILLGKPYIKVASGEPVKDTKTTTIDGKVVTCLLYTSPSPRDRTRSRMPSSA